MPPSANIRLVTRELPADKLIVLFYPTTLMKIAFLTLVTTLTAALSLQAQTTLRIRGSDTLGAKLVPQLAESCLLYTSRCV